MRSTAPLFAVVAPMRDEAGAVAALVEEIRVACAPIGPFEAVLVDDGSTDATQEMLAQAQAANPWLRVVRHPGSFGQSAALVSGVRAAEAPLIATLDGDGQNPPAEIPRLLAPFLAADRPADLGLVCGVRARRRDGAVRRLASRAANLLRRALLRDGSPDTGCGLKAFPRATFLDLPVFDHMHRFLPALFLADGWEVRHVGVGHRPRGAGKSKYGQIDRALVGALDLFGVWWLLRRRRRSAPARRALVDLPRADRARPEDAPAATTSLTGTANG
ncbi:glycosyltransferase family 2 protein [Rubrimonas cliftonensis]|uniref:Dolichol-phosphate mannosyltransferase n=1 Tax=Rubrimonas cliftonensis TaxID=89524 RepID=A0A1H4E0U0_9RHOB|nr:glycosyltransferase family 2 protein [Rubrimonas cliftonensis]SEA78190.1 dolichol-phosphate mannosyltransferase [Rubrimonas cliftonensis]